MLRFASTILAVGLLAGLVQPAPAAEPVRSMLEMRKERVVLQEWDLSCGAAALATLLNHQHGDMISERQVAIGLMQQKRYVENPLLVRLRHGFSLLDLKRFVERRGYRGIGYGGLELNDLLELAPIMVPIDRNGYRHFVIFRGQLGNRVLLADPAFGTMTMPVERFEKSWLTLSGAGRVGFVVARDDGLAPANGLAPQSEEFWTLH